MIVKEYYLPRRGGKLLSRIEKVETPYLELVGEVMNEVKS
jgi:hypothetical protein